MLNGKSFSILRLAILGLSVLFALGLTSGAFGQVGGAAVKANFGVDADVYADTTQFGGLGVVTGTDDWFDRKVGVSFPGLGVIDTTGGGAFRSLLQAAGDAIGRNKTFVRRMPYPIDTVVNGKRWFDAVYARDNITVGGAQDSSGFVGGNKNSDNPRTWNMGIDGIPVKDDYVDTWAHLRRDGDLITDSLWLFAGATTISSDGNHHFDYEFFQTTIQYTGSGLTGLGPDSGHTAWQASGGVITVAGDIITCVDFENGGTNPVATVRLWVKLGPTATGTPYDTAAIRAALGVSFTGVVDQGTKAAPFGYAEIQIPAGAVFARANGIASDVVKWTKAAPWGSLEGSGATFRDSILELQFAEVGINLSRFRIDVSGGPCTNLFGSILFKTRSSSSFSSALKDFVGPFMFGQVVRVGCNITPLNDTVCIGFDASFTASGSGGTAPYTYSWTGPNGFSANTATITIYNVQLVNAGTYPVIVAGANGCADTCYATLTVYPQPVCEITGDSVVCFGFTSQFCATVGMSTYAWTGPEGFTANTQCITIGTAGLYTVVITDANGCADTCGRTLVVNPPPVITCPDNDSVHAGDALTSTDFTSTDPDGDTAIVIFLDINPTATNTPTIVANHVEWITTCDEDGDYIIRLVASDSCGATDTCEFTVNVYDQPPQITCPDDDSVHAGDTLISTGFSVTDPDGDTASVTFLDINPTATNTPSVVANHVKWVTTSGEHGDYVIRLVATDDCRASDTCEFTVSIYNQAPVLTCPDNDSIHAGDTLISTDFTSTDPDGDTAIVTFLDINPTAIDTPTIVANHVEWITTCDEDGDYVIRLVATDPRGLADTCQFTVNVYHHPPQLTCPNDTSVSAGDTLISGDFTVTDPRGDLGMVTIINMYPLPAGNWPTIVGNHVEWLTTCNDTLGPYTIVLGVADSCWDIDSCLFTVNVLDHPPQLTCPNDTSVSVGDTLISGDFTVTDPGSDSRMIGVWVDPLGFNWPTIVDNHVEWIPRCGGTYTIVLGVADSCWNIDSCLFTVTVNDYDHTPQLTCPNDTSVSAGDTLISGDFTVTDPRGDLWTLQIINMYPLPAGPPYNEPTIVGNHVEWLTTGFDTAGTYTIVLLAADSCFSIDSCQFTVNVYVQAPVITSTPDTTAFVGVPYTYDVEATGIPAPVFHLFTYPTGMTIDTITGLIQWTPTAVGDSLVCVEAVNSAGADTQCFTISVAESAQVSILPDPLSIECKHKDTLWIHLNEKVVDMDSAFFKIAYEDTLITPDTVIKGPALVPPGNFDLSYGIHPDSILIGLTVLSGSFDGPGKILGIVFMADNYVTSAQVSIERSSLQNSEGEEIPHRTSGAEIQIDCPTSADGEDEESQNPSTYALSQNYPNPYNPVTQITYQLPQPGVVSLKIYNVQGQLVRTLVNEYKPAGAHSISWNGRSDLGMEVSSGIYLYRIQAGKFTETKRMILIK